MTVPLDPQLEADVRAWIEDDPDPATRAELEGLLQAGDRDGLAERFAGPLEFGTAGLRGALGAGPSRMNRATVRRAAAGLAAYVRARAGDRTPLIAIGCDARHGSEVFAADSAAVFAAAGVAALLLPARLPTPLLAFAVRHLGADAGVMVTASHNPRTDNGYKVYLGDGAQITPPVDAEIAAEIARVGSVRAIPLADLEHPLVRRVGDEIVQAYVEATAALSLAPQHRDVRLAYTALHGVGAGVFGPLMKRAGFPPAAVVAEQVDPDPDFPTTPFPNPEEPGVMDLLLAEAQRAGAELALANDPDADRLGAAVADPSAPGGWRVLRGDEIGALLADHVLRHTSGPDRLVVTTLVSSSLLERMAAAHGVQCAITLTGFKWIARAAAERPGTRFVFGYEEALGFLVGDVVRDKDGLGAAMILAEASAEATAAGETLLDRLRALYRTHGFHLTDQRSVRVEGLDGLDRIKATMARLRAQPPRELAGQAIREVEDLLAPGGRFPPGDVIVLRVEGGRVIVRPSGTEPKLKVYLEAVGTDEAETRARLDALRSATEAVLGL